MRIFNNRKLLKNFEIKHRSYWNPILRGKQDSINWAQLVAVTGKIKLTHVPVLQHQAIPHIQYMWTTNLSRDPFGINFHVPGSYSSLGLKDSRGRADSSHFIAAKYT